MSNLTKFQNQLSKLATIWQFSTNLTILCSAKNSCFVTISFRHLLILVMLFWKILTGSICLTTLILSNKYCATFIFSIFDLVCHIWYLTHQKTICFILHFKNILDRKEAGILYWRHIFYFTNKKSTVTFLTEVGLLLDLRTEIDCFDEKFYEEGRSEIPSQKNNRKYLFPCP